jgi:hypothetical protein
MIASLVVLVPMEQRPGDVARAHEDCDATPSLQKFGQDLIAEGSFRCTADQHAHVILTIDLYRCTTTACGRGGRDQVAADFKQCFGCKNLFDGFSWNCTRSGRYRNVVYGEAQNRFGTIVHQDTDSVIKGWWSC